LSGSPDTNTAVSETTVFETYPPDHIEDDVEFEAVDSEDDFDILPDDRRSVDAEESFRRVREPSYSVPDERFQTPPGRQDSSVDFLGFQDVQPNGSRRDEAGASFANAIAPIVGSSAPLKAWKGYIQDVEYKKLFDSRRGCGELSLGQGRQVSGRSTKSARTKEVIEILDSDDEL